jgi:hypothetical protein
LYKKARQEAVEIIRRYVRGEGDDEPLQGLVRRLDLHSIHHLCETLEFKTEDFRKIGFEEEDLARPLRAYLAGQVTLDALTRRIRHISQIFTAPEYQAAAVFRPELHESLSLLALILDPEALLDPLAIPGYLTPILTALEHRRFAPFSTVISRVLRDLGQFHFTILDLECSNGHHLPWSDLALLYRPPPSCDPRGDAPAESELAPVWFIPLAVTTRRFYKEGLPARVGEIEEDIWMRPENCRMVSLRKQCPDSLVSRFRPGYFIDPHGFAEVILDVEELSREEISFAIRLFALENGGRSATLDGQPIELFRASPRLAVGE